jgi:nitroimidazol reductase NimA-like FMN-containing flavoprotein (pyridoxamine 5'-phosphate oxidase superfamily)
MKDLSNHETLKVLETNYIGYLSFLSNNQPYVIPITYYYSEEDNCIISYSGEGHKIDAMRKNKKVSLSITDIKAVDYWKSLLLLGEFEELDGAHAKDQLHKFTSGVKNIILKKENRNPTLISNYCSKKNSIGVPIVYRIKILDLTGKYRSF